MEKFENNVFHHPYLSHALLTSNPRPEAAERGGWFSGVLNPDQTENICSHFDPRPEAAEQRLLSGPETAGSCSSHSNNRALSAGQGASELTR